MNNLLKDTITRFCIIVLLLLFIATTVFVVLFYNKFPPYIPFFNSKPWGAERLASPNFIFLLPLLIVIVGVGNMIVSTFIYSRDQLIARIVSINALLFGLLAFLAYLQIVLLVF